MALNTEHVLKRLREFDFHDLFIEELGWSNPTSRRPETFDVDGERYRREEVADLARVKVFKVTSEHGEIPDKSSRQAIQREISKQFHENLLIFADEQQTRTLWHWGKRDNGRVTPREHLYVKGQPGDLFLSKISSLFVDISELDEHGEISVVDVATRLRDALDVERVTRDFYEEYKVEREQLIEAIAGIEDERDRAWYASVMLNRLMFVYFLQRKGFIDNRNFNYLKGQLAYVQQHGQDRYYEDFLKPLFFDGLAIPVDDRDSSVRRVIGNVPYLGGSIFLPHPIEERWSDIAIPDRAFESTLELFGRWSWNLDDTPDGNPSTINPDVLGYIFEKYINQKAFGAYYTPPEITEYLCEQTINRLILERVNQAEIPGIAPAREFESVQEMLVELDSRLCRELLFEILPKLTLLDPACGSGAFLIAALKTLIDVYAGIFGRIEFVGDPELRRWAQEIRKDHHGSVDYYIRKKIIAENLYGVDIMPEAAEIAKLRLYLALVSSVSEPEQLEPLPNIDFNLLTGNSLIGLLRVDEEAYNRSHRQIGLFSRPYSELVKEKNRLIESYRDATGYANDLRTLRDKIEELRRDANQQLNQILLDQWSGDLDIKFEEATWDLKRNKAAKSKKRNLRIEDIEMLQPFHWGYEFDQVMNERSGFDAIITNPPWEILKPNTKEFLQQYSDEVTLKNMTIKELKSVQARLLQDPGIMKDWLAYLSSFPHQSTFFRSAPQYVNQISIVNGRRQGGDIDLYKLFVEQCSNLLRAGGAAGLITPGGVYTDLGTKQIRRMLFSECQLISLFGLTNERFIFENVHHAKKFCILAFQKARKTDQFEAAFRINTREAVSKGQLEVFLNASSEHLSIPASLVERLSPDSLSVMEFRNELEVQIAKKLLTFPLLGERLDDAWNVQWNREFDMTNDSDLFETEPEDARLPLFEGKMIHQFTHLFAPPRYWVDEDRGRERVLGRSKDQGQQLDYEHVRLGFRDIASNTNERTLISTMMPPAFHGNKFPTVKVHGPDGGILIADSEQLVLCALLNSYVADWLMRIKVTTTLNFFYLYQHPVPRLTERDPQFQPIVDRSARLICTTPEFDDLAREAGLQGHEDGVADPDERSRLRAELDGMIAHIYGLTEDEFAYILTTFPLVDQPVKDAALEAYREFTPPEGDPEVIELIQRDESPTLEFKQDVFWDDTPGKRGEKAAWKTVAAFLNTDGGDLLIGVHDEGGVVGLEPDYARLTKRPDRDGWQQAVNQFLINAVGEPVMSHVRVTIHQIDGRDVCRIQVKPSSDAVWVKEGNNETIYVRIGNSTRPLTGSKAAEYIRNHWS